MTRPPGAPMPLLVPAVSLPPTPPLLTTGAAPTAPAGTAPENSFGSVLAQAAGGQTAAPQLVGVDTSGTDPNTGEVLDPARVAAKASAGLFVVAPGVVLSQAGSAVAGDSIGGPTGGPAGIADPDAPPADAQQPNDGVSRAEELRLRLAVAPQAVPQSTNTRPTNLPAGVPVEPVAAEATDTPPATSTQAPGLAAAQLPLPAAAVPVSGTGLPAGRAATVVAQVPIVNDLLVPPAAVPTVAETAAPPVTATVAPGGLPGVTSGDRPNVAGDRLAADVADATRLAATAPATGQQPPTAFAQVLAGTPPAPAADAPSTAPVAGGPPTVAAPSILPVATAPLTRDTRVSQPVPTPAVPAVSANPVTPQAAPVVTATPPGPTPTAPAAGVAPRSNVAAPVTAAAVAPPQDAPATPTVRPAVTVPAPEPITPTTAKPVAAPAVTATPLPTTFAEVLRGKPGVEVEGVEPKPIDATADTTPAAVVAAPVPATPTTSPAAPAPVAAVTQPPAVQVADGVAAHVRTLDRTGETEFRMRLDPPELGRVHVRLTTDGDAVRGHVLVADEAVRQVIESQLPELRQRLEAAGLSVGRFDVSTDPGSNGRGNPYRDLAADPGPDSPAAATRTTIRPTTPVRSGRVDVTV